MVLRYGMIFLCLVCPSVWADLVATGRYTQVDVTPANAQRDPLKVMIDIQFGREVVTIQDAVEVLLVRTGFQLVTNDSADPYQQRYLQQPLPANFRKIGPTRLHLALDALAGHERVVVYDYVQRLIGFDLLPDFRDHHAFNHTRDFSARYSPSPRQNWTITRESLFSVGLADWAARYNWAFIWDLPPGEDMILESDYTIYNADLHGAIATAVSDYRKHGQQLIAQFLEPQRLVYVGRGEYLP